MRQITRPALLYLLACTLLALAPPVRANVTYTAVGLVKYGTGEPVVGRAVTVQRATISGAGQQQIVYTNATGNCSIRLPVAGMVPPAVTRAP